MKTVSMKGFTPTRCRQNCSCRSLKEPPKPGSNQQADRRRFTINHLRTTEFHNAQQGLECGSARGSDVQILSPRLFFSITYNQFLVCRPHRRRFCSCEI